MKRQIHFLSASLSLFLFLLLFLSLPSAHAQKPTDPRLAGLDTFVTKVLKSWNAPGVSIAVVEKNKVIYTGGFGYRDYEKKLPVTENTLFAIGSCTKAFTAALLGMLEKEGRLNIDKPVRNYLPELRFKNEYTNAHVTLRDMMSHRTGLPRHDYSWYGTTASRSELLERIQYLEPNAELRERYQYNNFMYMAQGVVIEKITGKSWEQNVKERILDPLNMNQTNFSVIDMEKSPDKSFAYNLIRDTVINRIPYRNIDAIAPAGAINSSAKDMANWLIAWINNGKFNGKEIIPAAFRSQAIVPQMATTDGAPGAENADVHGSGYGLGWGVSSYRGHYRVSHTGGIDGFITNTLFFPSDSIGIYVVSNQGQPTSVIRNFIADRMLGLSWRDWNKSMLAPALRARIAAKMQPNTDSLRQIKGTKPSRQMTEYTGSFRNPGYGIIKIFQEKDTVWVDYNEAGKRTRSYLQHYHYDVFRLRSLEETTPPVDAPKLFFNGNATGNIASLSIKMEPVVEEIVFEKLPPGIQTSRADLQPFTGDYDLNGTNVNVYFKNDSTLMVFIPGQPAYELIRISKTDFEIKDLKTYFVKFDMENNKVTGLRFDQPNGIFPAKRKK